MNAYAIDQELQGVIDAASDARDWLRKGDLQQAIWAVEEAAGKLDSVESAIGDAIVDEECGTDG
jgi:hypothetical protein